MATVARDGLAMPPAVVPAAEEEMRWWKLDSGVSAVSFGFVATAILVSMFLAMAILEHFLHPLVHTLEHAPPQGIRLHLFLGRGGERGVRVQQAEPVVHLRREVPPRHRLPAEARLQSPHRHSNRVSSSIDRSVPARDERTRHTHSSNNNKGRKKLRACYVPGRRGGPW